VLTSLTLSFPTSVLPGISSYNRAQLHWIGAVLSLW